MTFNQAIKSALNGKPCEREYCDLNYSYRGIVNLYFEYFGKEKIMKVTNRKEGCEVRLTEQDIKAKDWRVIV